MSGGVQALYVGSCSDRILDQIHCLVAGTLQGPIYSVVLKLLSIGVQPDCLCQGKSVGCAAGRAD
jgi:hypothetical protein